MSQSLTPIKRIPRPPGKNGPRMLEINPADVEKLASKGLTQEQIAASLGVSLRTLRSRIKAFETFDLAWQKGKSRGIEQVANALYRAALKGNVVAQIFWLKNNAGWRDKVDIEGEIHLPAPLIITKTYPKDITPIPETLSGD